MQSPIWLSRVIKIRGDGFKTNFRLFVFEQRLVIDEATIGAWGHPWTGPHDADISGGILVEPSDLTKIDWAGHYLMR